MLHNKRRKSKGEKRVYIKDLHARNDATKAHKKVGKVPDDLPRKRAINDP